MNCWIERETLKAWTPICVSCFVEKLYVVDLTLAFFMFLTSSVILYLQKKCCF